MSELDKDLNLTVNKMAEITQKLGFEGYEVETFKLIRKSRNSAGQEFIEIVMDTAHKNFEEHNLDEAFKARGFFVSCEKLEGSAFKKYVFELAYKDRENQPEGPHDESFAPSKGIIVDEVPPPDAA